MYETHNFSSSWSCVYTFIYRRLTYNADENTIRMHALYMYNTDYKSVIIVGRVSCTGNRHPIPGHRAPAANYE